MPNRQSRNRDLVNTCRINDSLSNSRVAEPITEIFTLRANEGSIVESKMYEYNNHLMFAPSSS